MTALPGSPEIQNVIPMTYFKTDTFAAPIIGLIASILMFTLGMIHLNFRAKSAHKNHEGYGFNEEMKSIGHHAFANSATLKEVEYHDHRLLTYYGDRMFSKSELVEYVEVPVSYESDKFGDKPNKSLVYEAIRKRKEEVEVLTNGLTIEEIVGLK